MVDAVSKARLRIVRIVFRILNLRLFRRAVARQKASRARRLVLQITMADADYYAPVHHEAASKIVGQENFPAKYSAGDRATTCLQALHSDGLLLADPVQWKPNGARLARETDEEAFTCNSPDLIARLGANETVTQERGRASRQLCADWPDRRRETGLRNE